MDCEHTTLLLPWFLNGSLDAEERRRVVEHLASCELCRQERANTELAGTIFAQHLPEQTLVDHGFGRTIIGLETATLEEHLAICPRCSAELELVRETAWRARGEGTEILPFTPRRPPVPRVLPAPVWRWAALAAGLTLVMGGLGGWREVEQMRTAWQQREAQLVAGLEQATTEKARLAEASERERQKLAQLGEKVAALEAPQPNVGVVDLYPIDTVLRGEPRPEPVEISAGSGVLTLLLQAPDTAYPTYELEIATPQGKRLHLVERLVRQSEVDFTVSVPTTELPDELTLRLFGRRGEQRREIARYELSLRRTAEE